MEDWQEQYSRDPDTVIRWIRESYLWSEGDWSDCIRRLCATRDKEIERLRTRLDCLDRMAQPAMGCWLIHIPDPLNVGMIKAVDAIVRGSEKESE